MQLSPEDMRFAMNDARERHKALVDLIGRIDQQALSMLQLYVTLAGAALTGAGVIFLSPQQPTYPHAVGVGLTTFSVLLIVGTAFCVAAIWTASVNLPGRDAEFWLWAAEDGVTAEMVYSRYLSNLAERGSLNRALNVRMSNLMSAAKIAGMAAPLVGFFVGAIASQPI